VCAYPHSFPVLLSFVIYVTTAFGATPKDLRRCDGGVGWRGERVRKAPLNPSPSPTPVFNIKKSIISYRERKFYYKNSVLLDL
jgi:hypothetical protein